MAGCQAAAASIPKTLANEPSKRVWLKHEYIARCAPQAVRYQPPAVKAALATLELAREQLAAAAAAAWRALLRGFAEAHYGALRAAAAALAALDCLSSLAAVAASPGYCRPTLLPDDHPPALHIQGG